MKKLMLTFMTLLGMGLLGPSPASAINEQDLATAEAEKTYFVDESSGSSLSPAIHLFYVGSATEAVVTITSATFLSYAPGGTLDGNLISGGAIDLDAASYDTIGELCDYIDKRADYGCIMLGAKRDDDATLLRDQTYAGGVNSLKDNRGFEVQFDTGPINGGGDPRTVHSLRVGRKPAKGKRVTLKECQYSSANPGSLIVYGHLAKNERLPEGVTNWTYNDTLPVFREQITIVASTRTWALNGIGGIQFAKDAHAVVSLGNVTTSTATVSNYLKCLWEEK